MNLVKKVNQMTSTKKNIFQAVYIIRSNILIIFIEFETWTDILSQDENEYAE